jgi:hypothetical protein
MMGRRWRLGFGSKTGLTQQIEENLIFVDARLLASV